MRRRLVLGLLVVVAAVLLPTAGWAQGCAMCKTALEQSEEGQQLAKSFDYGILFLMGVPYAMLGTVGFAAFRAYRKFVQKQVVQEQGDPESSRKETLGSVDGGTWGPTIGN